MTNMRIQLFGSEEYHEFVNLAYNDVFALFISGQNRSLIPDTSSPVSINSVNLESNNTYFVSNSPAVLDTQLDGLTTVLECEAAVTLGETNHIKLAIADRGDKILDSDIFLQEE